MSETFTPSSTETPTSPWEQQKSEFQARQDELKLKEAVGTMNRAERKELKGYRKIATEALGALSASLSVTGEQIDKNNDLIGQFEIGGRFESDGSFTAIETTGNEVLDNQSRRSAIAQLEAENRQLTDLEAHRRQIQDIYAPPKANSPQAPKAENPWANAPSAQPTIKNNPWT